MSRDGSFWRNVGAIGVAHVAILTALVRWTGEAKKPVRNEIVWMSGVADGNTAAPSAMPEPSATEEVEASDADAPLVTTTRSDVELPTPTPMPSPSATPKPVPTLSATPKPAPKATPKKTLLTKASPPPAPKPSAIATEKKVTVKSASPKKDPAVSERDSSGRMETNANAGSSAGNPGAPTGSASQFAWYGDMLHDRFFSEWVQPKSVVTSGARMSALVKLRIERDGRVSDFAIVRSSGNVVVDDSVAAVAKRVTRVDPPPRGLGDRYYEVNITFELNLE